MKKNELVIITDRLPSPSGAGAENVLNALSEGLEKLSIKHYFVITKNGVDFTDCLVKGEGDKESVIDEYGRLKETILNTCRFFIFGDEAIRNMANLNLPGKMIAWPDDPPYLPLFYKGLNSLLPFRSRLRSIIASLSLYMDHIKTVRLLKNYDLVIHHSNKHAKDFQDKGVSCVYACPPVTIQELSKDVQEISDRFVHIGHLGGAASLMSLKELLGFKEVISNIDFYGKKDLPLKLLERIRSMGAEIKGFAQDIDYEICSHSALVVSGNYPVGSRTRVLHAALHGRPIFVNSSALKGVPELKMYNNVYVYESYTHLLDIIRIFNRNNEDIVAASESNRLKNSSNLSKWLELILD